MRFGIIILCILSLCSCGDSSSSSGSTSVAPAQPDLIIVEASLNMSPATPVAGSPLTVTGLLKNVGGNYNADSPTVIGYANPYPTVGVVMFPPWDLSVAPGATVPFTATINNVGLSTTELNLSYIFQTVFPKKPTIILS
jgi:hypothetical protein